MSCLSCGASEFRAVFRAPDRLYGTTSESFCVAQCRACGLLQLSPAPAPEQLGRYYPKNYWFSPEEDAAGKLEERWRRLVLRDHLRFVARALRDAGVAGPVLDVGCGGGLFPGMLRERGVPAMGLDFSEQAASVAWRRNQVPAVCGTLAHAPIAAESCAAVTMFHVLEHLHDPKSYLLAAYSLLKPGGILVVQVPNAACWQFRLLGPAWNGVDVPRHLVNFRARDLESLLAACGFAVLRRKYFSLRDNPAGLATSLAPGLDPMARRVRRLPEGSRARLLKDLAYLAILLASIPFTAAEAACRAGSTVMIEARKKP